MKTQSCPQPPAVASAYAPLPPVVGDAYAPLPPTVSDPYAPLPPAAPRPAAPSYAAAPHAHVHNTQSTERWLGGKLAGMLAVLLVLTGLVLVGARVIPELPDVVKAAFLFVFSAALTAGGAILLGRARNAFTYALLVCGMIAFFVATYATHYHFGLIAQPIALVVSGAWMAVTIALVHRTHSWSLSLALLIATGTLGVDFLEGNADQTGAAVAFFLTCAYALALGALGVKLATSNQNNAPDASPNSKALVSLFVAEAALFFTGLASSWMHAEGCMLVVLACLLVALAAAPVPAVLRASHTALRINEIVVMLLASLGFLATGIAGGLLAAITVVLYGVFTAAIVALAGIRVINLGSAGSTHVHPAISVLFALSATCVLLGYLTDVVQVVTSPYLWSAVCMVCALAAIAVGFRFSEKPLRIYGLVVTLLCVAKIALFDTNGEPLVHAVALIVGGTVCFGISALYNFANKRIS